jgi:peptidyl-prolyl cis-trans isomerase D
MLDVLRRSRTWVLWAVILGVGGVFVLSFGWNPGRGGGVHQAGVAIRVGDRTVTLREIESVLERQKRQYRDTLGESFDEKSAMPFLVNSVASSMVHDALLAELGDELGLTVSDREVVARLRAMPGALDEKGRLDRTLLRNYAEREYGTERRFHELLRDEILAQKAARVLQESVAVSDAEVKQAIRFEREQVELAIVKFDGNQPRADLTVPEGAAKALIASSPERVRKAYEDRKAEFDTPEQVRARHILVSVPPGADDAARAAAREKLEAARKRILAGEDFATVAGEISDDPGSKAQGGDLGFFRRGQMVRAFEDAAFALAPGQLSEIVQTDFGLHLIRVEEKRAPVAVPFDQAQARVAADLARADAAAKEAKQQAEALSAAIKGGKSLEDAAREKSLPILRPGPLRHSVDGFIQDVGVAPDVLRAGFALTPEHPSDATVHGAGENVFVLIQLLARHAPTDAEVDAAVAGERQRVLDERRAAAQSAWLEGERKRLEARGDLTMDVSPLLPKNLTPGPT